MVNRGAPKYHILRVVSVSSPKKSCKKYKQYGIALGLEIVKHFSLDTYFTARVSGSTIILESGCPIGEY